MTMVVPSTAVGVFEDHAGAEKAVAELHRAGFAQDKIGVVARQAKLAEAPPPVRENRAEEGGIAGVFTGGALGAVLGAGAVAAGLVPGLGPVLGAGLLAALAGGATAGAVAGGLVGTLIGLGIPEEEARHYHSEFEAGRTLVTVQTGDRYADAVAVLRRCGARGKGSPLV